MPFDQTYEIVVPDCSLEELTEKLWKLEYGQPRQNALDEGCTWTIGDFGWVNVFDRDELRRVTAQDMRLRGDLRGRTLLCAEKNFALQDAEEAVALFRKDGFFPCAQGFLAALLGRSCRDSASLPLSDGNEKRIVWSLIFSPGSITEESADSRSFYTLSPGDATRRNDRLPFLGFKIKE